ncbi:hypothetical protein F4677DRAFT_445884 [Hypoxylon crocopeplum]|nr:hypothetical protein F4677DRAFT_445884 [Hypoxylon crocopeplum]
MPPADDTHSRDTTGILAVADITATTHRNQPQTTLSMMKKSVYCSRGASAPDIIVLIPRPELTPVPLSGKILRDAGSNELHDAHVVSLLHHLPQSSRSDLLEISALRYYIETRPLGTTVDLRAEAYGPGEDLAPDEFDRWMLDVGWALQGPYWRKSPQAFPPYLAAASIQGQVVLSRTSSFREELGWQHRSGLGWPICISSCRGIQEQDARP